MIELNASDADAPNSAAAVRRPEDVPEDVHEDAPVGAPLAAAIARETVRWTPDRATTPPPWPVPPMLTALGRGLLCRCPACGQTKLFRGYLRVVDECVHCGAPLGLARADDAPPYFTIFIVGHIVVLLMVLAEKRWEYSLWVSAAIWLPLTLVLSLLLLRPIKGATVGLTLKLGLMKSANER